MNDRMLNMQAMALAHQQQLQQLQPNIKSFASPAITPSNNYRVGSHHTQLREQANLSINTSQANANKQSTIGPASIRNDSGSASGGGPSNIHGRRSSPEVKVAVNRDIQDQRPHTAGHPFLQYSQAAAAAGGQLAYYRNEEFFTIINGAGPAASSQPHSHLQTAMNSAQNTITLSNNNNNHLQSTNLNRHRQPSQSQHENAFHRNNRGNMTLQHDDNNAAIRSGRHKGVQSSKSVHPNQKRKKNQTSRSAPRGQTSIINNNNIQASIVNSTAQQVININIQNGNGMGGALARGQPTNQPLNKAPSGSSCSGQPQGTSLNQIGTVGQRKRADPTKFHSQGGQIAAPVTGLMSASNKSKSRSRSQRRKQEVANGLAVQKPSNLANQKNQAPKPPRQFNHHLNKSSINNHKDTLEIGGEHGAGGPVDIGFSFDHKDNDSINFNEFSPSRIIDGAPGAPSAIGMRKEKNDIKNFLDSDSSISSPKSQKNHKHLLNAVDGLVPSSGPQTGKNHFIDKSAFLRHFSPDRSHIPNDSQVNIGALGQCLSSSERDRQSSRDARATTKPHKGAVNKKSGEIHQQSKPNRVNMNLFKQLMKEKFKQFRAKEEADEMSRRKIQNEALQNQIIKKAHEMQVTSQRSIVTGKKSAAKEANRRGAKNPQANSGTQIKVADKMIPQNSGKTKGNKQRSISCINNIDPSIFAGLPKFKERQNQILLANQNLSNPNFSNDGTIQHPSKISLMEGQQPRQPTQQAGTNKKREKSMIHEMNELQRLCVEEIKKETKYPTNKRAQNMDPSLNDPKTQSADTQMNHHSQVEIAINHNIEEPRQRSKSRGREAVMRVGLNPNIHSRIQGFVQKQKQLHNANKSAVFTSSLDNTVGLIVKDKRYKIKPNIGKLVGENSTKHARQGSFNAQLVKNKLQATGSGPLSVKQKQPYTQLKASIYTVKPKRQVGKNVFDYQMDQQQLLSNKEEEKSLTPSKSRILSAGGDNEISHELQEQYNLLCDQIQQRHELSHQVPHGGRQSNHNVAAPNNNKKEISYSNPPAVNRKIGIDHQGVGPITAGAVDSFSIDVSSIQYRDSSQKNRKKGGDVINVPQMRLEEQLKARNDIKKQNRTHHMIHKKAHHEDSPSKYSKGEGRSNSSPNTINANPNMLNSIVQSNSETNTLIVSNNNNNGRKSEVGTHISNQFQKFSDQGSNSNNASGSIHDLQQKIRLLSQQYGPHLQSMLRHKQGGKQGKISKTQMLVTLHAAAIIIQQNIRKYLARKKFYASSITYINTSEDEGFIYENKDRTINEERNILANAVNFPNISPQKTLQPIFTHLQTKKTQLQAPLNNVSQIEHNVNGSIKFYSANSSITEKVIQLSVISSGRQDPSLQIASGDVSNDHSISITPNNLIQVKNKQVPKIQIPISQPISEAPSGFSTVIKNVSTSNQISRIEEESKASSPVQLVGRDSPAGQQNSSSRRNNIAVPPLNLAKLDKQDQQQNSVVETHNPSIHHLSESVHTQQQQSQPKNLFGRQPFQEFFESHHFQMDEFQIQNYPDLLRIREEIIKRKEESEKNLLRAQELTPRTYDKKRLEIEKWVTKEKDDVNKSRKRFEEETLKTQKMIEEVCKHQSILKQNFPIIEPSSSTHRSKAGGDPINIYPIGYRKRSDSHREYQHPNDKMSYLDTLEDNKNSSRKSPLFLDEKEATGQQELFIKPSSSSDSANHHIVNANQLQDQLLSESVKKVSVTNSDFTYSSSFVNSDFQNFSLKPRGGNIMVLDGAAAHNAIDEKNEEEQQSPSQDGVNFPYKEEDDEESFSREPTPEPLDDSTGQLHKGLSRTHGSTQLHQLDQNVDAEEESQQDRKEVSDRDRYLLTTGGANNFLEENALSSDPRHHLIDTSQDEDPSNRSPELSKKLENKDFFLRNFDQGNAQLIVDQVKGVRSNSQSPQLDQVVKTKDRSNESQKNKAPTPASSSPEPQRSQTHMVEESKAPSYYDLRPTDLDEIDIQFPPSLTELANAPVSPSSNPDIPIDTVGSGNGGPLESRIITGGGSLNSTLSAGEAGLGNQDLIRVIQEVQNDILPPNADEQREQQSTLSAEQHERMTDQITDIIFQNLLGEMSLQIMDLSRDPVVQELMRRQKEKNRFHIFERQGIQTDLFAIERYVEEVLQEVLLDKEKFLQSMAEPIKRSPRDVLNQLQNSEIGSYEHFEQHYPPVLPLDSYLKLERRRKDLRQQEQSERSNMSPSAAETRNFLAECEHIHNKTLFDCINDSLLQFKPYAKDGEPLPWSRQNRRLKPTEEFTVEEMFEIVKHDLFRWAIIQAGTLPRREFVFGGIFDEELFAEIREKKLATLLAREMIENEPRWLNYEFEDAQVKIDIGDMILEQLVTETITILNEKMGGAGAAAATGAPSSNHTLTDNNTTFTNRVLL